jgi:hypothetical protein
MKVIKQRIREIIREHYDEGVGEILNIAIVPVIQAVDGEGDKPDVYVVQLVVAYASDDDYTIHTETVRVDDNGMSGLEFTLLSETDTQMKDAL